MNLTFRPTGQNIDGAVLWITFWWLAGLFPFVWVNMWLWNTCTTWKLRNFMFGPVTFMCVTDQKGTDTAPVCSGSLLVWVELWTQDASAECMRWDFGKVWGCFWCLLAFFLTIPSYESMTCLGRERRRKQEWLLYIWNKIFSCCLFSSVR